MMLLFYLLVLGTGMWAFFKSKRKQKKSAATGMEMALLGNRSLNWLVGVFTLTGEEKLFKWVFLLFLHSKVGLRKGCPLAPILSEL